MTEQIIFWALAILTVIPAIFVVTSRNLFHAGLWLLPTLFGVAGFFLTLGAEFLAAVQILIYVGGIMVLILFAVLLTRRIADPETNMQNRLTVWAVLAFFCIILILMKVAISQFDKGGAPAAAPAGTTADMGTALLGTYLLPFEVASIVLLAAIIGAIVIARGEKR
jgi:NADH-quinone oxidoreductase subunit J